MKKLLSKIEGFLLRNYKTILFVYLLCITISLWISYFFLEWTGNYDLYDFYLGAGSFWIGGSLGLHIILAMPLGMLVIWKRIFHPKD